MRSVPGERDRHDLVTLHSIYKLEAQGAMRREGKGASKHRLAQKVTSRTKCLLTDWSVSYIYRMSDTDKKFRRRAEARPDEMLDAALAVFSEKGFAATKVDEVARRAGVSKGTVYLYFPSKEALIEGIVRRAVAPIADQAAPDMAQFGGDPRLPIAMLIGSLRDLLKDPKNLALPRLILREVMNFPVLAELYRREVLAKVIPALTALVARGVETGHLRRVDPEMTVRSIVGPILAHVALSEVFGMAPEDGLALDRLVENHLDILFHGLTPEGGREMP